MSRVVLLLCLTAAARMAATIAAWPSARATASPRPSCLVARVGEVDVTVRDADQLAALLSPPPAPPEASRLVVDAALAHWLLRGELPASSPGLWLASYRDLLGRLAPHASGPTDLGLRTMPHLERAAAALRVEFGPCHVRLPDG